MKSNLLTLIKHQFFNERIEDNTNFDENKFILFLNKEGITVKTNTNARGHLGIFYKNRIDISKKADKSRRLAILAHEYAHKIHFDLEKNSLKTGGTLEKLFKTDNTDKILKELVLVTNFVDENSLFIEFNKKKSEISQRSKELEAIIKTEYSCFKKSKPFKEINAYFKKNKSDAKYLLKYDRIKILDHSVKNERFYSIDSIDKDFPEIPESLRTYIKLNSLQKQYKRLYRRKNKAENYYNKPSELFARFIEGFFIDKDKIIELAPSTYALFFELLEKNYYGKLKTLFDMKGFANS